VEGHPLRLVVFRLDGIEHAVPVEDMVEVVRMVAITPVAESPPWLRGVIDLRGRVIPVIDLRRRLGMPEREPDLSTPILVVRGREGVAGLVADEVVEVLALPSLTRSPGDGRTVREPALSSAIRHGERLVLVLDTDRIREGADDLALGNGGRPG
jgi:purine-binding chemotaxis protein CheW